MLSSNFASCRLKNCACLKPECYVLQDVSVPLSFAKPPFLSPDPHSLKDGFESAVAACAQFSIAEPESLESAFCEAIGPANDCSSRSSSFPSSMQHNTSKGFGDAAIKLVRGFEEGIASLKSDQARISRDLEATRDALAYEKEERAKERVYSLSSHSALGAQLLETLQAQLTAREQLTDGIITEDRLINSLRKLRAQHVDVSRALRQESKANTLLTMELQTERIARRDAENAVADLLSKNFALVEHNNLLISRDAALQTDISSMVTKSHADHWTRLALEDELRQARSGRASKNDVVNLVMHSGPPPNSERHHTQGIMVDPLLRTTGGLDIAGSAYQTIESSQAALRLKLIAAQDELHITERKLVVAVEQCDALSSKVASLQDHITTCVDGCGAALEVERQLRYDVEARIEDLLCEALALKTQEPIADSGAIDKRTPVDAWRQTTGHVQQMNSIAIAAFERCDILEKENLKQNDLIRELSAKIAARNDSFLELKAKVTRYEKMDRLNIKGHTMDIRQKARGARRLAQRKRKRKVSAVRIYNENLYRETNLDKSNLTRYEKVMQHELSTMKTAAVALPVGVSKPTMQVSRPSIELAAFAISSPPGSLDGRLKRMSFV